MLHNAVHHPFADSVQAHDGLQAVSLQCDAPETREETLYLVMRDDVRGSPAVRVVADFLVEVLADKARAVRCFSSLIRRLPVAGFGDGSRRS